MPRLFLCALTLTASVLHSSPVRGLPRTDRIRTFPIIDKAQSNTVEWREKTRRLPPGESILDKREIPDLVDPELMVLTTKALRFFGINNGGIVETEDPHYHNLDGVVRGSINNDGKGMSVRTKTEIWEIIIDGQDIYLNFISSSSGPQLMK